MAIATDNQLFPSLKKVKGILDNPETRPALEEGSYVGDDKFGKASNYDTGVAPSIALNDSNVGVEVHKSDGLKSNLWYHVGRVEGNQIKWGGSIQYDTGSNPSVAINDRGLVVEVHQSEWQNTLWYHVGKIEGNKINWGGSIQYDTGINPSVAINNQGLVVEVHQSEGLKTNLWYHIGRIENGKINWGGSIQYDSGVNPSVAITDDGLVVEVHKSESWNTLWYHVGTVEGNKINWGGSIQYDKGINPSVAITNDGLVVEVHQSEQDSTLWCHIGRVEGNKISWGEGRQYDRGSSPRVACNAALAVEAHNSEIITLSYSILRLPSFYPRWIEARGSNSYCYYQLDNHTTDGQRIAIGKTIKVDPGAPYLYAVLIKNDDLVDFPMGAILTIKAPDGTVYHQQTNEEKLLVMMSDSSLRSLVVKDPMPGDWIITLTVSEGVEFHFEFQTLPSQDVSETINNFLRSSHSKHPGNMRLHKRDLGSLEAAIPVISWLGMAAIGLIATAAAPVLGAGVAVAGLVGAATAGTMDLWSIHPGPSTRTDLLNLEPIRLRDSSRNITETLNRNRQGLARVRIATWNVYHGNRNGRTPEERMRYMARFGWQHGVHLIAFQEVPQRFFANPEAAIAEITEGTGYAAAIMPTEYPANGRTRASQTSDGYLILYNAGVLTLGEQGFYQPDAFLEANAPPYVVQARPPYELRFGINGTTTNFRFLTWHAEAPRALTNQYPTTLYNLLIEQGGHWIVAGDFNVNISQMPEYFHDDNEGSNHELRHYDRGEGSLDHIISNRPVINVINSDPNVRQQVWEQLFSDHHYALFGEIEFPVVFDEEHEEL